MLINLSKTKLVVLISSVVFFSSMFTAIAASKVINLKAGQSITIDDVVVSCQTTNVATFDEMKEAYKKTRAIQVKFCKSFNTYKMEEECLSVKAKHIDEAALKLCKSFNTYQGSLDCFKAIVNKIYDESDLKAAKSMSTYAQELRVLQNSGLEI